MAGEFEKELRDILRNFNYENALEISKELHQAEERGATLTRNEERMWGDLTQMIIDKEEKDEEFLDPS